MFTFIHTADWQIGMMAPGLGDAAEVVRAARIEALGDVLRLANDHDVDAILVAGDQFEHNQVSQAIVEQTVELLNDLTRIPLYLIPGNHDPFTRDSIYRRAVWRQLREHIHVLTRPAPVKLGEGVTLYPCPIWQKFGTTDPTAWIPPRGDDDNGLRIGLAHGTMKLRDIVRGHDDPIPLDAAIRTELDYLALGHVHATIVDGERRASYCGAHETTRFGEGDSGNVLRVSLAAVGEAPQVEVLRTGKLSWRDHLLDLDRQGLAEASRELRELPEADRTLLRVMLQGQAPPEFEAVVGELRALLQQRFLYHRLEQRELRPAAFEESFADLLVPHLRQAAEQLRGQAEAPSGQQEAVDGGDVALDSRAVAQRALEMLQEIVWQHGRDAEEDTGRR